MSRTRVYGWMGDRGGCGYYRVQLPLSTLPKDRWDVTYSTVIPTHWRDDADIIIGQRVVEDAASGMWRDMCRNPNVMAVYEVDDDLPNVEARSIGWQFYSQAHIRENFHRNIAMADLVTTSTPYLAELLAKHNPNVALLPNCIPALALDITPTPYPDGSGMDGVTIGYTSSATHDMDWEVIADQMVRLLRRHDEARVHFIGAAYPGLPPERVAWTKFVHGVPAYLQQVARFDIGIAPLRPHLFNRAKSHLKALEYAALGIPAVVSRLAPYEDFVQHQQTGVLVRHEHEWTTWLRTLLLDHEMRAELGAKARAYVSLGWTIEGNIGRWEAALRGETRWAP